MNNVPEKLKEILEEYRGKKTRYEKCEEDGEDFNPDDWVGGQIDDAYYLGLDDGRIEAYTYVLQLLEEK